MKLGNMRAAELQWRRDSNGMLQPVMIPRRPQAIMKDGKWDWLQWTGYITFCIASVVFTLHFLEIIK